MPSLPFLDLTLATPAANLALDEALLLEAEAGRSGEILRFWEWPQPAVVLGAGCRLADNVDEVACRTDGVPILRRASGGGTVLLGPGCLCFSLVLAYERSAALQTITTSYQFIFQRFQEAFPGVEPAGTSDLTLAGQKFSGNAQQRKRHFLLHHGTLLHNFQLGQIGRYLRLPLRRPAYREDRDHGAFLVNLPLGAAELKTRVRTAWAASQETDSWPEGLVRRLVADKYDTGEWIRRR